MNYAAADNLLQGRCKLSRKIANNTYLRRDGRGIVVRFHSRDVVQFQPGGAIKVSHGGFRTVTTKARINEFSPAGYGVGSGGRKFGPGVSVLYKYPSWTPIRVMDREGVVIHPDGHVTGSLDPGPVAAEYRAEVNAIHRERYKERFWILKARNGGKLRKPLTLDIIQNEDNISTRTAMIKVYGLERFLAAVSATEIAARGDYRLISYSLNSWNHIRALKMVCPSTQTVYIHPVEPSCNTVEQALDWMFQVKGYLDRLQAEA